MPWISSGGKPGITLNVTNFPRDIWYSGAEFAQYVASPITLDGNATRAPQNSPFIYVIPAGTLFGRITSSKKWANSIIGTTNAASLAGATSLVTDLNTATELVRRQGTSGTFNLTGPATAGGTAQTQLVTYSAVNTTTTGVITVTAVTGATVTNSLIQPTDGSQNILTAAANEFGTKMTDPLNTTYLDTFEPKLIQGGGTIEDSFLYNLGTSGTISDPTIIAGIKAAIKSFAGSISFRSDENPVT